MLLERAVAALESIAASLSQLALPSDGTQASTPDAAPSGKPRGRPRKEATVVDAEFTTPPVTVVVATKPEPAPEPEPVAVTSDFPYDKLKAVVIELANSGAEGKAAAINVMGTFGVRKASDAPADKWKEMHDDMQAVLDVLNGNNDFA